jgi:hypothetical protein
MFWRPSVCRSGAGCYAEFPSPGIQPCHNLSMPPCPRVYIQSGIFPCVHVSRPCACGGFCLDALKAEMAKRMAETEAASKGPSQQ